MHLDRHLLGDQTRSAVIGEEPVGVLLPRESQGLGFAQVKKPGAVPVSGLRIVGLPEGTSHKPRQVTWLQFWRHTFKLIGDARRHEDLPGGFQ